MTRIHVDFTKCQGYANCVVSAPEVFDLDDNGKVDVLRATVDDAALTEVREAVRSCPAAALTLKETTP